MFTTELRRIVTSTGMSQRELAQKLYVSTAQANRYLCGRAKIPPGQLDTVFGLGGLTQEEQNQGLRLWQQAWEPGTADTEKPPPGDQPVDTSQVVDTDDPPTGADTPAAVTSADTEMSAPNLPGSQPLGVDARKPEGTGDSESPPGARGGKSTRLRRLLAVAVCVLVGGLILADRLPGHSPKAEGKPSAITGTPLPATSSPTAAPASASVAASPGPASSKPGTTPTTFQLSRSPQRVEPSPTPPSTAGPPAAAVPSGTRYCSVWQYRVTEHADVVNVTKTPVATAAAGQTFYRSLDPTVPKVQYRYYGSVGAGGPTGYVLQEKLEFVREVCGAQ